MSFSYNGVRSSLFSVHQFCLFKTLKEFIFDYRDSREIELKIHFGGSMKKIGEEDYEYLLV